MKYDLRALPGIFLAKVFGHETMLGMTYKTNITLAPPQLC